VTGLIESGYDDRRRPELPLIVEYAVGVRARTRTSLSQAGARIARELRSIDAAVVHAAKDDVARLWAQLTVDSGARTRLESGVDKVWLDGPVRAVLDESAPQVGAPRAWEAGLTGKGVTVAVLDSGIDASHPDVEVLKVEDFTETGDPRDLFGHGTHVASIATGDGTASSGRYQGVAHDADLLVGKVLDDGGYGLESWALAGMEWATSHGAKVINLSLGACATDGSDPMSQAVDALTETTGALFVVAAGNHPSNPFCFHEDRVSAPAAADRALAVGSVSKSDELSAFSNTGPRLGDSAVKPNLTAPGESIVAARAADTQLGPIVDEHYVRASGTSMATPHVAGAAAILAQRHPDWTGDQLAAALMASAAPLPGLSVFQQGAGRLDIGRAIDQRVTTSPAALSMGVVPWPHTDDEPITKDLTYHNAGEAPVTLDLVVVGVGPDGGPLPEGMFTLSAPRVTVPAGGSAQVSVTATTDDATPDGHYSAWVTASRDGEVVARTPVGLDKEVESYTLTLDVVDRSGDPAPALLHLVDPDAGSVRVMEVSGEPVRLRLPRGRYDVMTTVYEEGPTPESGSLTLVAKPELSLTRDMTVSLDARAGRPIRAVVDSATADPGLRRAVVDNGPLRMGIATDIDTFGLYATPTGRVTAYRYVFEYQSALAELEPVAAKRDGATRGGRETVKKTLPRGYNLLLTEKGRIPDPTFRVRDRELARFRTSLHSQRLPDPRPAYQMSFPRPAWSDVVWGQGYEVTLPGQRLDLYSPGEDVRWSEELRMEEGTIYDTAESVYRRGPVRNRSWNAVPLGPVAHPGFAYDRLWVSLSAFAPSRAGQAFVADFDPGSVHTTLRKNGVIVGESDEPNGGVYPLPDEEATYELTTRATREVEWSVLATDVQARWKATGPGPDGRLPFVNLWISGPVDLLNRAPAGEPFPLRLTLRSADGRDVEARVMRLSVSFDDGASWRRLRVTRRGAGFHAVVPASPGEAAFVSLRASVRTHDGRELDQTVIRAYRVG
jgi:subtilisin family serine protease